ncbi:putative carboxylesterase [Lupinus albus]|uniref:Putative carboxylesterase n=1 Tax=Lupinus albus TaxID=3870 RepID=A0A6A4Q0Y3_LUPAL|nr:putative carboxylesterase [Lupinus albus]
MDQNSISTMFFTGEMISFYPSVLSGKNIISLYIKGYKCFLMFFLLFFPVVSSHRFPTFSRDNDVAFDLSPIIRVYKNGRVERLEGEEVVPPTLVPTNIVESKDVIISNKEGISVRLFIPKTIVYDCSIQKQKLPLFVYFHGGAFIIYTPFSPNYHNYVNSVVSKANAIGVSVHYRRAPEHPIPIANEDSWLALKWVASHVGGNGPDEWLNQHADFENVFFAGDSAGANLAHHMGIRVGLEGLPGVKLQGIVLANPYFWGVDRIGSESSHEFAPKVDMLWRFASPKTSGSDDPLINPDKDPNLVKLGCKRVLLFVAEKDILKDRGLYYKELLQKRGWNGIVDVIETKGEDHVFHIFKPTSLEALVLLNHVVTFMKRH